jgi:hypothetical protein
MLIGTKRLCEAKLANPRPFLSSLQTTILYNSVQALQPQPSLINQPSSTKQNVLVAAVHSTWLLHDLNRLLFQIPPRLRRGAIVAALIYRLLPNNADLAVLRLWRTHRARLYALVADIAFRRFSTNDFRTHTVSP